VGAAFAGSLAGAHAAGRSKVLLAAAAGLALAAFLSHLAKLVAIGSEPRLRQEEREKLRRSAFFFGVLVSPEIIARVEEGDRRVVDDVVEE